MFMVAVITLNLNGIFYAKYQWNKAEITELFCVNKDKPRLKCDGKCHLQTTLQTVEDQSPSTGAVLNYVSLTVFVEEFIEQRIQTWHEAVTSYKVLWVMGTPLHQLQFIFKPPI
jgi:hypothetical protein